MIAALLVDFDGTLTRPDGLDFAHLRRVTGCPDGQPILEYIETIEDADERCRVERCLLEEELAAARQTSPNPGADELIAFCRQRELPIGLITRNSIDCVRVSLNNFPYLAEEDFAVLVSRDDALSPKPSPAGVYFAAERLGTPPEKLLVVGDYLFDIDAGAAAGATTVYLTNGAPEPTYNSQPDYIIRTLPELLALPLW